MQRHGMIRLLLVTLLTTLHAQPLLAEPPLRFEASYDARYDNMSASASRSLAFDAASGHYTLQQQVRLTLFGATVSSISETSTFLWQDEQPLPRHFEFLQKGIGARERSASFDYDSGTINFVVNKRQGSLPLEGLVFDELSGYLMLKAQLASGHTDISVRVLDRDKLEDQRYRVLGEEQVATPLGEYATVKLERLREGNSERRTELWLAPELDYMLVRLLQTEPNGKVIRLDLKNLTLDQATATD